MKKIIFITACIAGVALFSFTCDQNEKDEPSWKLVETKKCKDTPIDSGDVIFQVNDYRGHDVELEEILCTANGNSMNFTTNDKGIAKIRLPEGKCAFQFYWDARTREIYTDSIMIAGGCEHTIDLNFEKENRDPMPAEKPVIYIYSDKTQPVTLKLDIDGDMGYTYPRYDNGWNFTAGPDGKIMMQGKQFDYLFWEAQIKQPEAKGSNTGFLVTRDSLTSFFESKLTAMGLTPREQEDFITYWVPQMQKNETNFIQFLFNDDYNSVARYTMTPAPDHVFRVFMLWSDAGLRTGEMMNEQKIESASRGGLTLIEWGGGELPDPSRKQCKAGN